MPSDTLRRVEAKGQTEGRAEGLTECKAAGETVRLLFQIQQKITRGKSSAEIADELEDTEEAIQPLYETVLKYGADCPAEEIYRKMHEN